jgi:hypothetical protein
MSTAGVSLMQALEQIDDPRSPSNGTRHDFRELLVVAICAMLSDNDTYYRSHDATYRKVSNSSKIFRND